MSRLSRRNPAAQLFSKMKSFLGQLRSVRGWRQRKSRKRVSSQLSNGSFLLESRQLLAGISFDSNLGHVLVGGTEGNDEVLVTESSRSITVSQKGFESQSFSKSQVKLVWFVGLSGDDRFENDTSIPSRAFGNAGNDTLIGGSSADRLAGNEGNDQIFANGGDDLLVAGEGNDQIDAGSGNDKIYGVSGTNTISAGAGDDHVLGGVDRDVVNGEEGNDKLYGYRGHDVINGGAGGDIVSGHTGDDDLNGGEGDDQVFGGAGEDRIIDGAGKNVLAGGTEDDVIRGGSGPDTVYAGSGVDNVRAGGGNDLVFGQDGADTIYGDDGHDVLRGDQGNDRLYGGDGNDKLSGLDGHDLLEGNRGNDLLFGGDNDDDLYGDGGADKLFGGSGRDGLFGGGGGDQLEGGLGPDRFLVRGSTTLNDYHSTNDALIRFVNESSNWTNNEIKVLDRGFRQLHRYTRGVRVLQNTLDKSPLTFYKVNQTSSGNPAQNQLQMSYLRNAETGILIPGSEEYSRKIVFADWNESSVQENEFRVRAVIHEIAHNWDSRTEIESAFSGNGNLWTRFTRLSGWRSSNPSSSNYAKARGRTFEPFEIQFDTRTNSYVQVPKSWWYLRSAEFARDYGATSPVEDWATIWEEVFSATPNPDIKQKLNVVRDFLALL